MHLKTDIMKSIDAARFNYEPSDEDRMFLEVGLATLLPAVKVALLVNGAPDTLAAVLYPDYVTCKMMLGKVISRDGKDADPWWKPYLVRLAPKWAKCFLLTLEMADADAKTFVIGVGFYNPAGNMRGGFVKLPWTVKFDHQIRVLQASLKSVLVRETNAKDLAELIEEIRTTCAVCGELITTANSANMSRCDACDCVTYCSPRCAQAGSNTGDNIGAVGMVGRASRHAEYSSACQHIAYARHLTALAKGHADRINDISTMYIVPAPMPVHRLTMEANGVFDDARRSRLLWDVTKPASAARLVPSCIPLWMAWNMGCKGQPLTSFHLAASLPDAGMTALRVSYVDIVIDMSPTEDVFDFLGNVQRGLEVKRKSDGTAFAMTESLKEHPRFDHLQPRDEPGYWRMQTGGKFIFHEGIPSTNYRLSRVTFID